MNNPDLNERIDELLLHLQRTAAELSIYKGLTYKQVSQRRKYQRTRAKQAINQLITEEVEKVLDDFQADDWKGDNTQLNITRNDYWQAVEALKQRNKSREVV